MTAYVVAQCVWEHCQATTDDVVILVPSEKSPLFEMMVQLLNHSFPLLSSGTVLLLPKGNRIFVLPVTVPLSTPEIGSATCLFYGFDNASPRDNLLRHQWISRGRMAYINGNGDLMRS